MATVTYQADIEAARSLLYEWITRNNSSKAGEWLTEKQRQLGSEASSKIFFMAFSGAPRFSGKLPLALNGKDLAQAENVRAGWYPANWTTDQAARVFLVLSLAHPHSEVYSRTLDQLAATADVGELTALALSLPLLPYPELHRQRTSEGIRTNMSVVFNAIALDNPYPADYLEEGAWNQLVLKAIFVGSPLYRIQGLDRRTNPALAQMLSDFAHERWAAGRTLTPELWRPLAPHLTPAMLPDIERLFAGSDPLQQQSAALVCAHSSLPEARTLLRKHPELEKAAQSGTITWDTIARDFERRSA
jgi:hypothetical protein